MLVKGCLLALCLSFAISPYTANAASDLESGVKELASQLSKNILDNKNKKIAILEFKNIDRTTSMFGVYLSEELITNLFVMNPGQFEVVERNQLDKILKEQKLGASGFLDASAMNKIGKILGVDAIVIGSIADLDDSVKINARIISVASAKVFAVASTNIPKIGIVAKLMKKKINAPIAKEKTVATQQSGKSNLLSENGFSFSLDKCVRKGTQINCFLTVIAEQNDNVITVYGNYGVTKSIVYDDVGTARAPSRVDISGGANRRYIKRKLIAGVPNKLKLQFDKMSGVAKKVSLLSVKYHSANNNQADVAEFRGIVLQ